MGRLSNFRYRDVARRLRALGFLYDRPGEGSHEIWRHAQSGRKVVLPRHTGDVPEGTLRAVLKQAGIDVDAFLKA